MLAERRWPQQPRGAVHESPGPFPNRDVRGERARELMHPRGGAIVNVSSVGAGLVVGNYAAVGTSKAAVEALSRYLAAEFALMESG